MDRKLIIKMVMSVGDSFFEFGSGLVSSTVQAHAMGLKADETCVNDRWNLIKGEYSGINFPVLFKQKSGKHLTDILDTGWPSLLLISDRMKKLMEEEQITGWKSFPIKLYDKKNLEVFGYWGFSIVGRCGPINYQKSKIIRKKLVSNGPICSFYKGLSIDAGMGRIFLHRKKFTK